MPALGSVQVEPSAFENQPAGTGEKNGYLSVLNRWWLAVWQYFLLPLKAVLQLVTILLRTVVQLPINSPMITFTAFCRESQCSLQMFSRAQNCKRAGSAAPSPAAGSLQQREIKRHITMASYYNYCSELRFPAIKAHFTFLLGVSSLILLFPIYFSHPDNIFVLFP